MNKLLFILCGPLLAAAAAWVAFQIERAGFAPAILFPLLIGAAIAVIAQLLARSCAIQSRVLEWSITGVMLLAAIGTLHYLGYHHFATDVMAKRNAALGKTFASSTPPEGSDGIEVVAGMANLQPRPVTPADYIRYRMSGETEPVHNWLAWAMLDAVIILISGFAIGVPRKANLHPAAESQTSK